MVRGRPRSGSGLTGIWTIGYARTCPEWVVGENSGCGIRDNEFAWWFCWGECQRFLSLYIHIAEQQCLVIVDEPLLNGTVKAFAVGVHCRRHGPGQSGWGWVSVAASGERRRHGVCMGCRTVLIAGPRWSWTQGFACAVRVLFSDRAPCSDSGTTPVRGRNVAALRPCG